MWHICLPVQRVLSVVLEEEAQRGPFACTVVMLLTLYATGVLRAELTHLKSATLNSSGW
jgi:site-specific recombinase XerD